MSIISELREAQRLAQARRQPNLPLTAFPVRGLLAEIQLAHFADEPRTINVWFIARGSLASVAYDDQAAHVYMHQVLNHPGTPAEVFRLVFCHELLHLRIEPAEIDGQRVQHPPAFWQAERQLCPQRTAAWCWIWHNLGDCLRQRPKLQRIDVLPSWRTVWSRARIDLATCLELADARLADVEQHGW